VAGPGGKSGPLKPPPAERLRLDKWLFQARFFKSRDLAAEVVTEGHLRLNGQHCLKPGHGVGPGDVLTFAVGARIRVIKVLSLGNRRGPASEAQELYLDLDPPADAASYLE
jgi:ribosome-associated heat shock protein Hsp15